MMSSYRRIPKESIKVSEQKIAMNDQFTSDEETFKRSTVEQYVEESKEKIKQEEEKMLKEIEEKRMALIQQVKEEGKQQALLEAKEIVRQEYEEKLQQANLILEQANQHYQQIIAETEQIKEHFLREKQEEIIDFFLLSIKKMIHQEMKMDKINMKKIYDETISQIKYDTKKIYVRVHPKTEELLSRYNHIQLDKRIEFLYDLTLNEVDLIVETEREFIDFSLETQLEELRLFLRGVEHD